MKRHVRGLLVLSLVPWPGCGVAVEPQPRERGAGEAAPRAATGSGT